MVLETSRILWTLQLSCFLRETLLCVAMVTKMTLYYNYYRVCKTQWPSIVYDKMRL